MRTSCLSRYVDSVRVQERSMDGTEYNPLFSWNAGVRSVRVCYADVLLSGRIPNVKSWVVVQADPDCEVRCVGGLGKGCCGVWFQVSEAFLVGSLLQGHWMLSEEISCGVS